MKEKQIIYAFIDSQNLNKGIASLGWKLDFKRFRTFIKDKYRVSKAFIFIGYVSRNRKLYKALKEYGYEIVFKPTVKGENGVVKGNIDAELVLHSVKVQYQNYDKAIVVSSDGDFYCLYEELIKDGKLEHILIPSKYKESSLLKKFQNYKIFLYREKRKLRRIKNGRRRNISRRHVVVSPS